MYNTIDQKILCLCKCEYCYFFNKANVWAVGLGYKFKHGFYTNQKCIVVFVTNKVSTNKLHPIDLIPACYKGIPTDVVETGKFSFSSLTAKVRPVIGGYSIGPASSQFYAGTMGCVVTDGHKNYILSCNHVLTAEESVPLETPIDQPSPLDGGKIILDRVAFLSKFIPLIPATSSNSPKNVVDCAIAKEIKKSILSPKIAFLGNIHGVGTPTLKQSVQKVGKQTELTKGQIQSLGMIMKMGFEGKSYYFKNQIITTSMSTSGDSGSILLDEHMNALGLLMGSLSGITVYNPIQEVLKSLDVTIVTH